MEEKSLKEMIKDLEDHIEECKKLLQIYKKFDNVEIGTKLTDELKEYLTTYDPDWEG